MNTVDVETINTQARKNAFSIEAIPWELGVDHARFWCPESMVHLFYCPTYCELHEEERRFYNQLHAVGICEQFIFLEELLLVQGLGQMLKIHRYQLSVALQEAITVFIEEELKHSAMFERVLKAANPEMYADGRLVLHRLPRWLKIAFDLLMKRPDVFLWWLWAAVVFEETTLDIYRKYKSDGMAAELDPLFYQVHKYHAMDEVRHFQLDAHLVEAFWTPAPRWKKRTNAKLFVWLMHAVSHPGRTVRRKVERLVARFPRLESLKPRLLSEVLRVYEVPAWQEAFYSRQALPHTFAMFDRFPELAGLASALPLYSPGRPGVLP